MNTFKQGFEAGISQDKFVKLIYVINDLIPALIAAPIVWRFNIILGIIFIVWYIGLKLADLFIVIK